MNNKVLVGMSGGVDSSVAAALLMDSGYTVSGVTLRLVSEEPQDPTARVCCSLSEVESARSVCDRLGLRHYVFNFTELFEQCVVEKFVQSYLNGQTPNPCIDCNRYIKFKEMLNRATLLEMDHIATGHYARVQKSGGRYLLQKAADGSKDQTYVLYSLTQQQLAHTLFPLGGLTKKQVRQIAAEKGFQNAQKPDSQDICFVPDGDYAAFIERRLGHPYPQGDFVDEAGRVIGRHRGAIRYTIGQRRGLGMGFGKHMYVLQKNTAENRVTLGEENGLFKNRVLVRDFNPIAVERLTAPVQCTGKLRYSQREAACTLHPVDETTVLAEFDEPQRAVTAGQAAVFYSAETVLGGGTITG